MTIAGYRTQEKIYESRNSLVYRGRRDTENQPVILKMLKQAYPPPEKVAWFQREYELTRSLELEGVVKVYDLTTDQHRPVIVLEDFGGESLELHLKKRQRRFTLAEFLPLSLQMADILGRVHQQHVIHKDVNPSNVVWNPQTGQVKLIDFGISTALTREAPVPRNPTGGEGTLAYLSPEQTGRMNRILDYRTDLYSLGVTFYELLTGQLPFPTVDALALMHAHLARKPTPPEELVLDLPSPLSAIILKLMAKNAEDRYQSAYGLKADLEECLRQWQTAHRIAPFPLSRRDVGDRLHLPQKLYGRETEVAALLTAFERVSRGAGELVFVSGSAGIGKSALVQELYKPITRQRGYFITGKFEQFHKNIPYAPLIQAFQALIRQILTESEDQVALWRERLLSALGPNGEVMIDVIPEIALIIGPQPPAPVLPPVEAQNRLNLVFQNFVHVFTQADHPLLLFLDDLQWADAASLNFVRLMITSPENHYLFIIGAFRDNEVYETHPVMLMLDELRKARGAAPCLLLQPLDCSHICQLLTEMLHCTLEGAQPLAELVLTKTKGAPFFVNEFLKSLYAEELLRFDFQSRSWQWDIGKIQTRDITDNVVALMRDKLQRLALQTQQVLRLAACIGAQFDLRTLAIVYQRPLKETALDLWAALEAGLVFPLDNTYKLMALEAPGLAEEMTVEYKFAHDQIQQAAYSLIPERELQTLHLHIGRLLLQRTSVNEREQHVFDIVNHLNLGKELICDHREREKLAELNLRAGRRAKAAAAHKAALNYLRVGLDLLEESCWETQYSLALSLHEEAAEAAYLNGDYGQLDRLTEAVLWKAKTLLDKVKIYECNIEAGYTEPGRMAAGLTHGLAVLEQLGIALPLQPAQAHITQALEELQQALAGKDIASLLALPRMTDPHKLAAMSVLRKLSTLAYMGVPELYPLINFNAVNLSATYGNTLLSAWAYAAYGPMLCGIVGDIDAGYQFGQLALELVEQFDAPTVKANVIFLVNSFVKHWKEHTRETLKPLLNAHLAGLDTGVVGLSALAAYSYVFQAYWSGKELTELEREMTTYGEVIGQLKQETILNVNELFRQTVLHLMGDETKRGRSIGKNYNEETLLSLFFQENNVNALCMFYLNKLTLDYLFSDYPQAVAHAEMTERYLWGAQGQSAVPAFYLYDSLARLALFSACAESEQKNISEKVASNQEKMRLWARHAPMNFLHKFYLVEAERARVLGSAAEAREYYDKAITLAHENEYLNEEALAYELAGRFYLGRGHAHLARYYLHDARYAYLRWGALAKVRDLETRHPQFFETQVAPNHPQAVGASTIYTEQHMSSALDVTSVLKASQTIASEIVLDRLLARLMRIVIENAGAQRGVLLFERDGQLVIEAEGSGEQEEAYVLQSVPVEARFDLPISIFRYVQRTKERIVLNDAREESIFATDPYLVNEQPKSLLCAPLIKQGQLTGILYLENNLTTGAFTADRVAVLNLLAAEAAISIENARLYTELEEAHERLGDYSKTLEYKVEERTQALQEKNRELELANQQVQEASRRKSQFLAGMSHELRTPMNAILGFTRLVLRRTGDLLPERQRENLFKVRESAEQLLGLINQLLDLSRLEAGRMDVHPRLFDARLCLLACYEMVSVSPLIKSEVQVRYEIAEDVGQVNTDEEGLRHIVLNLLSNAIKFTDSGEVVIRATLEDRPGNETTLVLTISDTGVGIPAQALDTIFEEFQQVEGGMRKREGTGLGLPIARRWAEFLRGTISVTSEMGKGSTFTVEIPAVYQAEKRPGARGVVW
ncbi:MAG: AAA family ATPase [Deltaproteobacteria bacterium]|nr:AAA family ATPase [Deltaproteobacteria bacterium]